MIYKRSMISISRMFLALSALLASENALSLSANNGLKFFKNLPQESYQVSAHVFKQEDPGLKLLNYSYLPLEETAQKVLGSYLVSPLVQLKEIKAPQMFLTEGTENMEFEFRVNNVPLCDFYLSLHRFSDHSTAITGKIPAVDLYEPAPSDDWPDLSTTIDNAISVYEEKIGMDVREKGYSVLKNERCLFVRQNSLIPVWDMIISADSSPYRIIGDSYEIMKMEKRFFDATGEITSYVQNPKDATLETSQIDMIGDGTLTSDYFITDPVNENRAQNSENVFNYPTTDRRFSEATLFSHATKHLKWFFDLGYTWTGPAPMTLRLHGLIDGADNNAKYVPDVASDNLKPMIHVCDGDGLLNNLTLDRDVVAHELGHHIIWTKLKKIEGESVIVHEGMADYFLFADTGDSCLGESICPNTSQGCWIPQEACSPCWTEAKCLRTAENTLTYDSDLYNAVKMYHLRSQVISGLLWDLRIGGKLPADHVDKLALAAATVFLERESGLRDFLLAILHADKSISNGQYACEIYNAAISRGFTKFLTDVDCTKTDSLPDLDNGSSALQSDKTTSSKTKKDSKDNSCGILPAPGKVNIGITADTGNKTTSDVFSLVLLLLPVALIGYFRSRM